MNIQLDDIHQLVRRQNEWRGSETLNLIASENVQSPAVREIENNDFMGRYAEGHPNTPNGDHRYYEGTHYIDEIESLATREMKELAKCRQADVRPISGNAANTALTLGILRGGDSVIVNSIEQGGHISHNPIGVVGRRIQKQGQSLILGKEKSISMHFWPVTPDGYHLDVPASLDLIEQTRPNLAILDKACFSFRNRSARLVKSAVN